MAEQLRSATVMVEKILSDPETMAAVQVNPGATLRKVEREVTQGFPPPTSRIVDSIWLVIVVAFAMSLMYSVWVLGHGVTAELSADKVYAAKSDTVLTVVTTIVGFLAGLLAPSPVNKK